MKKEKFIEMVEKLIKNANEDELNKYQEALEYFEIFKSEKEKEKPEFTENGLKILKYMQDNFNNFNNIFKAKEIGEGLFMSSRSVSGSLRKLVTDNYVEKIGNNPSIYSLTEKGKEKSF